MLKRVYLSDWFINSGIVGFINIMNSAEKESEIQIKENYIEFDTEILSNFSEYYFSYFMKKYNIAEKVENRVIENYYKSIESLINKLIENPTTKEEKEKNKRYKDSIKNFIKYIKETIKTQKEKIKKFNETSFKIIEEEYSKIKEPNSKEELEELLNSLEIIVEEIKNKENNERITLNYFKSILSKNYFGQPSFLNVVKSACSVEEQKSLMQKDYVSNIIETAYLQEILEDKYTVEQIEEHIDETKNITKEIEGIYNNLKKQITKGKELIELQNYIKSKTNNCFLCEEKETITENYTESNFVPLAVSSENMTNFFWNQNAQVPICSICKLMLFCVPAGVTLISKIEKDSNMKYKETELYSFINYDTSVSKLRKVNNNFADNSKKEKNNLNPYMDTIMDIVEQEKNITKWQLDNIFVVEFETEYLGYSRMQYFNIQPHVAKFLQEHANVLQSITDYSFRLQLTDMMLKNEDTSLLINNRLREAFNDKKTNLAFNCYLANKVRFYLNILKKESEKMTEEINKCNKNIYNLYRIGQGIRKELKSKNEENKSDSYIYRMINSIKANNKNDFMDVVIRLHLYMERDVSTIFLEVMQDSKLDFATIGHSFLSGLISDEYRKDEEDVEK